MSAHARLGPSAAHRWLTCPGSVRLVDTLESTESSSVYAGEGTRAHTRAEIEARYAFKQITRKEYNERISEWKDETTADEQKEMGVHARSYVKFIKSVIGDAEGVVVLIEQRVQTGVPGCWGTADCILVFPSLKKIVVIDYKYGIGIRVDARDNPQLMLYGVGALESFNDVLDFEEVEVCVYQPRLSHVDSWKIKVGQLVRWRDEDVYPMAELALSTEGYIKPSPKACQFCPVSGNCLARMKQATELDFGNPDLLKPEEMGVALNSLTSIERWCKDVRAVALRQIYSEGIDIPGWKVVKSGGRRVITDPDSAIDLLVDAGFDEDAVSRRSPKTLADLEKVAGGAKRLQTLLGDLLIKSEGKEALAPDGDNRDAETAIADAQKDFG